MVSYASSDFLMTSFCSLYLQKKTNVDERGWQEINDIWWGWFFKRKFLDAISTLTTVRQPLAPSLHATHKYPEKMVSRAAMPSAHTHSGQLHNVLAGPTIVPVSQVRHFLAPTGAQEMVISFHPSGPNLSKAHNLHLWAKIHFQHTKRGPRVVFDHSWTL